MPAQSGFSTPFQLNYRSTGLCLRDTGLDQIVAERVCETESRATSRQLWHNNIAADRTVKTEVYRFRSAPSDDSWPRRRNPGSRPRIQPPLVA